ncbi:hypothetical protein E6C76_20025 [Pseudothauera nasutitermitis]|uniref:Uncharacterized protein n=1 Tax=Pseudothauera nasutitermitis TaxID=2565930 RepID=A0A4S4ARY9_9RHOO|nr:hypothetical protein [Pseudothauera nasutitermitis]THF61944.1 hypothetical protein E6C76_20025 [Pseudothauera nasutitermitis]
MNTPARRLRAHLHDPSGGLGYHLRAWRFRHTLWAPFVAAARAWQRAWTPPADELVIVGPSAGYTLDADFLARFGTVHALEPDPLARWLLARRFPAVRWCVGTLDCLADAHGPAALAADWPRAAVLFSNVLGQALEPSLLPAWRQAAGEALRAHHWASYHDALSAGHAPQCLASLPDPAATPDTAALARALWHGAPEVIDHDTFGLAPQNRQLACWRITPRRWQIVEWGCHAPG